MPATSTKQRVLSLILNTLSKHKDAKGATANRSDPLPVLEQVIFAICREGVTRNKADAAFRSLQDHFFDWNEVRVSTVREVADALGDLPNPETRAYRIISFLQEVFETTYSFDLEILHKKGLKLASKQLDRYQVANPFTVAWVIQRSLGGHAIPIDEPTKRVVARLGLVDATDMETIRSTIEHLVPKIKDVVFSDVISGIADEYCYETDPACPRCPMYSVCPKLTTANAEPEQVCTLPTNNRQALQTK